MDSFNFSLSSFNLFHGKKHECFAAVLFTFDFLTFLFTIPRPRFPRIELHFPRKKSRTSLPVFANQIED